MRYNMETMTPIIGLMAGTSADGIDASLVFTDGLNIKTTPHALTMAYTGQTRRAIFKAYQTPKDFQDNAPARADLDLMIAKDHAIAVEHLIKQSGITPELIAFHGQTILHTPSEGISVQAGDAQYLASRLNLPIVHDFRQNDLAHGGEGAPLAPIYHQALMQKLALPLPAAMVNIGGISNASLWDGKTLIGFDSGPGNALMDDAMGQHNQENFDKDGHTASKGVADEALVDRIMTHAYFARPAPKSLDRMGLYAITRSFAELESLTIENKLATLALLTARSLVRGILNHEAGITTIVISGGGAFNPVLMTMIRNEARGITILSMEDRSMDSRFIEAELMAFLAARTRQGLPITFPMTTGVKTPQSGGVITYPHNSS